jgi:hypothetical protein
MLNKLSTRWSISPSRLLIITRPSSIRPQNTFVVPQSRKMSDIQKISTPKAAQRESNPTNPQWRIEARRRC